MTSKVDYTDLIYKYVESVGRQLPKKRREDIQMEILSILEDALEDRAQAEGREPDESMVVEVLKEFGAPEKMAASYLPQRYLVGPRMFPAFLFTIQIFFVIVVIQFLVAVVISFTSTLSNFWDMAASFWQTIPDFYTSMFAWLGGIVIIFAVLERVLPHADDEAQFAAWMKMQGLFSEFVSKTDELPISKLWNPRTLKEIEKKNLISPGKLIFEISFLAGVFVLFNFFPQWVGVFHHSSEWDWVFIPLLTPNFSIEYLPYIDLFWALNIGLKVVLLQHGGWTSITRWFWVGVKTLGLVILASILNGSPVVGLNPDYIAFHNLSESVQAFAERSLVPNFSDIFILVVGINLVIHGLAWLKSVLGLASQGYTFPLTKTKKS